MNSLFSRRALAAAFCAICLPAVSSAAPRTAAAVPDYSSLPLIRGKENQLMLKLPVAGKTAWVVLDTGSPITCVDEAKSKLFQLVPSSANGSVPQSVVVNGERHRIATAPVLNFGPTIQIQNLPVVMIDLGPLNQMLRAKRDRPNDAILGLDTLHSLNAVIDCGAGRLLLRNNPGAAARLAARLKSEGYTEIPMRLNSGHLLVGGAVNRFSLDFILDTGSPVSVLDQGFARSHRITLTDETFSMRAIHFETGGAKVGRVADMRVGKLDLGRTLVAVFDIGGLLRGGSDFGGGVRGLLGSRTLLRTKAYIDCENSKIYLKTPDASSDWGF